MPRLLSLKTYRTVYFQVRNLHGTFALSQLSLWRLSPPKITCRFVIDRPRAEETIGSQQREKPLRLPEKCHQHAHVEDGEIS